MADSEQRLRVTFSRAAVSPEELLEAAEARMPDAGPVVSEYATDWEPATPHHFLATRMSVTLTVSGPQASPLSALYRASTAAAITGLMKVLGIDPSSVLRVECVQAEWEDAIGSTSSVAID